jgi:hypothetical protein
MFFIECMMQTLMMYGVEIEDFVQEWYFDGFIKFLKKTLVFDNIIDFIFFSIYYMMFLFIVIMLIN